MSRKIKKRTMNTSNIKNKFKPLGFYQTLGLIVVLWLIIFVLLRLFVSAHGQRTWWQAIFHHNDKFVQSQAALPVPNNDDNVARTAILDFYHNYTTATDSASRKSVVAKNTSPAFNSQYLKALSANGPDSVACISDKVTNVQIINQALFAKTPTYYLSVRGSSNFTVSPTVVLAKVNGAYQITGIYCGNSL